VIYHLGKGGLKRFNINTGETAFRLFTHRYLIKFKGKGEMLY